MPNTEWEIPTKLQPDPDDYAFDVDRALQSVVGIKAQIPADAFTAEALGTERSGSGVVIREDGLLLTIGYLITEADSLWLVAGDGRALPGHPLAYDQETGLGLVQPLGRLALPALPLGQSEGVDKGAPAVFASAGGRRHAIETQVIARQQFAGYWEYLLDDAIFTAPAHPFWGGGGLIGADGRLLGIGSLILQQGDRKGHRLDMNMIVPIDLLKPILDDLLTYGRVNRPARPWLGLYASETDDTVVVGGLADGGPADRAGVRVGDRIEAIGGEPVTEVATLWRQLWAAGPAGSEVWLRLGRETGSATVKVRTADRTSFLKAPRLH